MIKGPKYGINHIWHRAIFYDGRKSPKRVDCHEISQNRFADIPDWERLVYERVINSLNSLYKHQAQLLKLIQRYRALQAACDSSNRTNLDTQPAA